MLCLWVLGFLSVLAVLGMVVFVDPIAQASAYHQFSDSRSLLGINHFWNVTSNAMFALSGLVGLWVVGRAGSGVFAAELRIAYGCFFMGVTLVALGSAYYHFAPDNGTLVWDRLPMTVAFMALVAIILGEHIAPSIGGKLLLPLVLVGMASVVYWAYTEASGHGDLRAYVLVQFLPLFIIPVILLLFPSPYGSSRAYWVLIAAYLAAKVCEHFDAAIYDLGLGLSGHTLKHLIAALALLLLALEYWRRASLQRGV